MPAKPRISDLESRALFYLSNTKRPAVKITTGLLRYAAATRWLQPNVSSS